MKALAQKLLELLVPEEKGRKDSTLCTGPAMRNLSTFALEIERTDNHDPTRVSVVLSTAAPDADGVLRLTPQCMTLDELEGAINALQDELDVLRADGRRAFTVSAGHA